MSLQPFPAPPVGGPPPADTTKLLHVLIGSNARKQTEAMSPEQIAAALASISLALTDSQSAALSAGLFTGFIACFPAEGTRLLPDATPPGPLLPIVYWAP